MILGLGFPYQPIRLVREPGRAPAPGFFHKSGLILPPEQELWIHPALRRTSRSALLLPQSHPAWNRCNTPTSGIESLKRCLVCPSSLGRERLRPFQSCYVSARPTLCRRFLRNIPAGECFPGGAHSGAALTCFQRPAFPGVAEEGLAGICSSASPSLCWLPGAASRHPHGRNPHIHHPPPPRATKPGSRRPWMI